MEETKYSEILKGYTDEQFLCAMAITKKEKAKIYIKEKEEEAELKRRLEEK